MSDSKRQTFRNYIFHVISASSELCVDFLTKIVPLLTLFSLFRLTVTTSVPRSSLKVKSKMKYPQFSIMADHPINFENPLIWLWNGSSNISRKHEIIYLFIYHTCIFYVMWSVRRYNWLEREMVLLPLPARHEVTKEISNKYLSVCSLRKVLKKLFF